MSLKEFIKSRIFLKHLGAAVILIVVLIFFTMQALKIYTHHGVSYPVPDFSGIAEQEVLNMAKNLNVMVEIVDSVYSNDDAPGVVVDQFPEAGFRIKENRVISLIINSKMPEQVTLPQLTNISVRQAIVWAENSGLKIGQITYEPSEYNDLVLKVRTGLHEIYPGELLYKGDSVDLIVGRMYGNSEVPLPDLTGFTQEEAQDYLVRYMLNMGTIMYDSSITTNEDSLNARIWRQTPSPSMTLNVYTGSSVDIWVSVDSSKFQPVEEPSPINF
ncbi:MAG: PASTA domain-containing protein [Bacteroidales bacterium]|jgi:beta-lactam-binding protein with PASTA domain|nr:PASTA domain-containing protein [Bacteroidales bacterium]